MTQKKLKPYNDLYFYLTIKYHASKEKSSKYHEKIHCESARNRHERMLQ